MRRRKLGAIDRQSPVGRALWGRAKELIPGGNMLLSKRAEMFLPDYWPSYFSKSRGCTVWDLDGNKFLDFSLMGVGTNILGYGNGKVDRAVRKVITLGNMSSLNCPEEVQLAEDLLEINPWAGMVRLARTGGEANAVAVRIARAAAGRTGIAVCGYHGWHDWYLAANLGESEALSGHLLPGLSPKGVPEGLRNSIHTFEFNDFEALSKIVANHEIGVIKLEVARGSEPKDGFLEKVRKLASDNSIVLVFDECTSGFRQTFGGAFLTYGVEPDVAVFGKALGNGYAITAIVGRKEIMQAGQETFISSTFWTERIGPSAALATLAEMKRLESWTYISEVGAKVKKAWARLADDSGVGIEIGGLDALPTFSFSDATHHLRYKTFLTQEMLSKGYLAGSALYLSIAHTESLVERYLYHLNDVFQEIAELGPDGVADSLLAGEAHSGFKRLN